MLWFEAAFVRDWTEIRGEVTPVFLLLSLSKCMYLFGRSITYPARSILLIWLTIYLGLGCMCLLVIDTEMFGWAASDGRFTLGMLLECRLEFRP